MRTQTHFIPFFIVVAAAVGMVSPAASAQGLGAQEDPDQKVLYNYTLTMDKVKKLAHAIEALQKLQKTDPDSLKQNGGDSGDDAGNSGDGSNRLELDKKVKTIEKLPKVVAVLKKDGLTPREYVVGSLSLFQAWTSVALKREGAIKEYPPETFKIVNKKNITFLEKHFDEINNVLPKATESSTD